LVKWGGPGFAEELLEIEVRSPKKARKRRFRNRGRKSKEGGGGLLTVSGGRSMGRGGKDVGSRKNFDIRVMGKRGKWGERGKSCFQGSGEKANCL